MSIIWDKFYRMEPMKYYQPLDYTSQNAKDMIANKDGMYIAEQKFDGEFARLIKYDDRVIIQSRSISKVTGEYGDKTALVPHIVEEAMSLPNGTVLLGELCFGDERKTSRDVGTILRCKAPKAIERQKNDKLLFRLFDCLAYNNIDLMDQTYHYRLCNIDNIFNYYNFKFNYIFPPVCCQGSDFEDFLQSVLARGGEGIVIHSLDYLYSPGSRPAWTTLKVKRITTELELKVTALLEPKKHYEGACQEDWKYWIGTYQDNGETVYLPHAPTNIDKEPGLIWEPVTKPYYYNWKNGIEVDNNGTKVRVASGLTDADREWLASSDAEELVANGELWAVVSAMEVTPDGSLRHPRLLRLRTDKE